MSDSAAPVAAPEPAVAAEIAADTNISSDSTAVASTDADASSAEVTTGDVAVVDAQLPPITPLPARLPIGAVLAAAPSHADAFFAHALRSLQTRAGTDVVLQFICYTARLSGSVLELASLAAVRHSAQKLIAMAFKLPPSTSVLLSSAPPPPPAAAFALQLAAKFKALSALLSETRTVTRLWGLLGLYFALKRLVVKSLTKKADGEKNSDDAAESRFDSLVAYTQVLILIAYQVTENIAFLGSKKILGVKPATQGKLGIFSVKCWGTYVGIELARLLVERKRKLASGAAAKDAVWASTWRKGFLRNLAWAPITMHWSMGANGPLPDIAVSLLAMYPSTSQMIDLWNQTASA